MTNQTITFNALDSYLWNEERNTLNTDYLNDCIYMQMDIVWRNTNFVGGKSRLSYALESTRRKPYSIVWEAFIDFANEAIENVYSGKYKASSEQLKKYLKKYGFDYSVLQPVIEEVERMRREYLDDL